MSNSESEITGMTPKNKFAVKNLIGRDSFHTWQFAMMNYFELNNLDDYITPTENSPSVPVEKRLKS